MTKTELITEVAKKAMLSEKEAKNAVNAFTEVVEEALADNQKVQLVGFGTFDISKRAARTGKNPRTGETIMIPEMNMPRFKAGKALKEKVNN